MLVVAVALCPLTEVSTPASAAPKPKPKEAPSLTGVWTVTMATTTTNCPDPKVVLGTQTFTVDVTQTGANVAGGFVVPSGSFSLTGTVSGQKVSLTVHNDEDFLAPGEIDATWSFISGRYTGNTTEPVPGCDTCPEVPCRLAGLFSVTIARPGDSPCVALVNAAKAELYQIVARAQRAMNERVDRAAADLEWVYDEKVRRDRVHFLEEALRGDRDTAMTAMDNLVSDTMAQLKTMDCGFAPGSDRGALIESLRQAHADARQLLLSAFGDAITRGRVFVDMPPRQREAGPEAKATAKKVMDELTKPGAIEWPDGKIQIGQETVEIIIDLLGPGVSDGGVVDQDGGGLPPPHAPPQPPNRKKPCVWFYFQANGGSGKSIARAPVAPDKPVNPDSNGTDGPADCPPWIGQNPWQARFAPNGSNGGASTANPVRNGLRPSDLVVDISESNCIYILVGGHGGNGAPGGAANPGGPGGDGKAAGNGGDNTCPFSPGDVPKPGADGGYGQAGGTGGVGNPGDDEKAKTDAWGGDGGKGGKVVVTQERGVDSFVLVRPGNGGNGGKGGMGGDGGRGGNGGAPGIRGLSNDRLTRERTDATSVGGWGGDGGMGGFGGAGGDGGNAQIDRLVWMRHKVWIYDSRGGDSGPAGGGGVGGGSGQGAYRDWMLLPQWAPPNVGGKPSEPPLAVSGGVSLNRWVLWNPDQRMGNNKAKPNDSAGASGGQVTDPQNMRVPPNFAQLTANLAFLGGNAGLFGGTGRGGASGMTDFGGN
ncbi:MAG: hypothetical protein HY719_08065 [Planctomycetes bacterium]|nr:hypothetical protein [Planctomycetota bacterium]